MWALGRITAEFSGRALRGVWSLVEKGGDSGRCKGRTERRVQDCGTTETRVCMWSGGGGGTVRAAAAVLFGGSVWVLFGFVSGSGSGCMRDEFLNAIFWSVTQVSLS